MRKATIRNEDKNDAPKLNCDDSVDPMTRAAIMAARAPRARSSTVGSSRERSSGNKIRAPTTPKNKRYRSVGIARRRSSPVLRNRLIARNAISKGGNIDNDSVDLVKDSSALAAIMTVPGSNKCKDRESSNNRDDSRCMTRRISNPRISNIISEAAPALRIDVSKNANNNAGISRSIKALVSPLHAVRACIRVSRRHRRASLNRSHSQIFRDLASFVNNHHGEQAELLEIALIPFKVCFFFSMNQFAKCLVYKIIFQDRTQAQNDSLCAFLHSKLKSVYVASMQC